MLKVAIIGCGTISPIHINAINLSDKAELYAVVDINNERACSCAEKNGCKAYTDYHEMLNDSAIDIVHICTPHYLHGRMAVDSMEAGKHVLIEKPLSINRIEAEAVISTEERTGMKAGVCFQNRYNYTSKKIKEFINSGRGGKILGAKAFITWDRRADYYAQSNWRGKWETEGGGVLINQAIHTIDLLTWFLGNVESVKSQISTRLLNEVIEVENSAEGLIRFESGVNALLYATTCYCEDSPVQLNIKCEKADIKLSGDLTINIHGEATEIYSDNDELSVGKSYWGNSHNELIEDFYNSIINKSEFHLNTQEGYRALETVFLFYKNNGIL
ncbi:MAG: Gfo/Idh/MocA family oxidoreductase [Saccharofermentanales bacterium]